MIDRGLSVLSGRLRALIERPYGWVGNRCCFTLLYRTGSAASNADIKIPIRLYITNLMTLLSGEGSGLRGAAIWPSPMGKVARPKAETDEVLPAEPAKLFDLRT